MSTSGVAPRKTPSGRVPRGSACIDCRRRKLRCDGVKPICGPCLRANRESECEYTDGPLISPTQALEQRVAMLSSRIHELEHPEEKTEGILLHDPHAGGSGVAPESPSHSSSSSGSGSSRSVNIPQLIQAPSSNQFMSLMTAFFMPHANQLGFFMNKGRFSQALRSPHAQTQLALPLLNILYLWAVHLSNNDSLHAQEPEYVGVTVKSLATALTGTPMTNNPRYILQIVQAQVLMSTYFFSASRFLEGKYHCSAAAALAISLGLHKVRSADATTASGLLTSHQPSPPFDPIEEGERVDGFWTISILDKCWAVALGWSRPHIFDDGSNQMQIDTPWPMDSSHYEEGRILTIRGSQTVRAFLTGAADLNATLQRPICILTWHAKAATLYEQATRITLEFSPGMANLEAWQQQYYTLDSLIDRFKSELPPMSAIPETHKHLMRNLLVVHSIAYASTIQIDIGFGGQNASRNQKSFTAAVAIALAVSRLDLRNMKFIDPIMAIIWSSACSVIIASGLLQVAPSQTATQRHPSQDARNAVRALLNAMNMFKEASALMASQIAKLQDQLKQIGFTA
ncbi:hypothetical protein C8Q75DRAFT_810155 [Abortiporus biennis]|nr:hypothetical protein C8Q75DRAFT_810155 [Abortiporus biennis]